MVADIMSGKHGLRTNDAMRRAIGSRGQFVAMMDGRHTPMRLRATGWTVPKEPDARHAAEAAHSPLCTADRRKSQRLADALLYHRGAGATCLINARGYSPLESYRS